MKKQYWTSFLLRNILFMTLGMTVSLYSKGQSYSQIIFDKQQSQYFGSYNLITLHQVLYSFEDKNIRDTLFGENNFLKKTAGFGYRMTKLLLLDGQIDGFIALAQHEVFGHGARARELGYSDVLYNMHLLPPFGDGSGLTHWGATLKTGYDMPTSQENIALHIGGVDCEMLLADNLTNQMLLNDTLHYRQGLFYLFAQNNLLLYLWGTRYTKPSNIKQGNDMVSYVNDLNNLYSNSLNNDYDVNKLSIQSLISFANPFQIYSAFSILYAYGIKGKKQLKMPMIKFGSLRYLPAFNYSLTPFGSQYHFVNYIRYKNALLSGDFNIGDNTFNNFYGFSIKGFNIVNKKRIAINFHLDVWSQPDLELEKYSTPSTINKIGEAFKIDLTLRPFERKNKMGLFLQTGYKTKGYLMGEPLAESLILRYGLSLHL
ncbi:MAG: hypothetical protein V2A54_06930 [Bacteroidota bacterium]